MYDDYHSLFLNDKNKRSVHRKGLKLMRKYVDEHSVPDRIIRPNKSNKITDCHSYSPKTWPGFPADQVAAQYARDAERRSISRNGATTEQIIKNSVKRKNK